MEQCCPKGTESLVEGSCDCDECREGYYKDFECPKKDQTGCKCCPAGKVN